MSKTLLQLETSRDIQNHIVNKHHNNSKMYSSKRNMNAPLQWKPLLEIKIKKQRNSVQDGLEKKRENSKSAKDLPLQQDISTPKVIENIKKIYQDKLLKRKNKGKFLINYH